jgi:TP901 family phage tail tape measure protein
LDVFDLYAKIAIDTSDYESGLSSASEKSSTFGSKLSKGLKTAAKVAAAAIGAATTAVAAFAKSAVSTGAEFDSSMSQVMATMGYTTDELNDSTSEAAQSMEALRNSALDLASTSSFTASEVADAYNYMALAGYDVEESMEMIPNVLALAAAGSMDLATASDMLTDSQTALGLSMDDTTVLADQMAKTASTTNTSVSQLGEAILSVGGTAKSLSGGTTELNAVLGALADNGIKGAEAGTHLRNIMLAMNPTTEDAAAAFEQLGIDAYDSEGNMRSLEDIFTEMSDAMDGMTDQEKTNIISTIFNKTDIASVNALLATSADRWDELSAAIEDSTGAAQAMADTQLDNLTGDVTLFQSALDSAKILLSDELTPTLRNFVQFGTSGITELSSAFQEGGLTGMMDALGGILSDGIAMITDMLPTVVSAGTQLLMSLIQGITSNLPQLMDAAVQIVTELIDSLVENMPMLLTAGLETITTLASGIADSLPTLIPTIIDVVLQIVDTLIANVDMLVDAAIEIIVALAEGLINALPSLLERVPEIIESLVDKLVDLGPELLTAAAELIGQLVIGLISNLPQILASGVRIVATLISGIGQYYSNLLKAGKEIVNKVKSGIQSKIDEAKTWGKDLIANFISGITAKWEALKQTVSNVAQTVKDFLGFSEPDKGPLSNFHTYAPDMMELFAKGIKDNAGMLQDTLDASLDVLPTYNVTASTSAVRAASASSGGMVVNITVNGAQYKDEETLAQIISEKIQASVARKGAVWA